MILDLTQVHHHRLHRTLLNITSYTRNQSRHHCPTRIVQYDVTITLHSIRCLFSPSQSLDWRNTGETDCAYSTASVDHTQHQQWQSSENVLNHKGTARHNYFQCDLTTTDKNWKARLLVGPNVGLSDHNFCSIWPIWSNALSKTLNNIQNT